MVYAECGAFESPARKRERAGGSRRRKRRRRRRGKRKRRGRGGGSSGLPTEGEIERTLSFDFFLRVVRALGRHLAPITVPSPLVR